MRYDCCVGARYVINWMYRKPGRSCPDREVLMLLQNLVLYEDGYALRVNGENDPLF